MQQAGIDRDESNRRRQYFLDWIDGHGYYRKGPVNKFGLIAYRVKMPNVTLPDGSLTRNSGKLQWIHTNADRWIPGEYDDLDPTDNQSIMRCVRRMTDRVESTRRP